MKCRKHPRYMAKGAPTSRCKACWWKWAVYGPYGKVYRREWFIWPD